MTELADAGDDAATTRIVVVRGGEPSPEELAALVVALTPVAAGAHDEDGGAEGGRELSAWARAALIENLGGRRPVRPGDLHVPYGLG